MYRLAIFDLDGTLLNTQPDLLPAFNAAVEAYGYAPCPPERFGKVIGNGFKTSLRRILPPDFHDDAIFEDMCCIYHETYDAHYADHTCAYVGMADALAKLQECGVALAVLSNKVEVHSEYLCKTLLPNIRFSRIAGAGSGLPLKPDPSYLFKIMDELQVRPDESIFIGDSDVDVITAHRANMRCIGCEWGYRGRQELVDAGADFMAGTPHDLLKYILEG